MKPPITRLFLSADIAGSTAYKQRMMTTELETWPSVFIKFFQGLPGYFKDSLESRTLELANPDLVRAPAPVLWKAIGDEIVFWQEVRSEDHVGLAVLAWRDAILKFRGDLKAPNLDVKAAAWTASFPFPNREIAVPKALDAARMPAQAISANEEFLEQHDDHVLDFIGPNIDTGFRLAARSNPNQFQVSLEVAEILVDFPLADANQIYYGGQVELKGVHGGRPYPTFWLDSYPDDKFAEAERQLLGTKPATSAQVSAMVDAALDAAKMPRCWLADSSDTQYTHAPKQGIDDAIRRINIHLVENPEEPVVTEEAGSDVNDASLTVNVRQSAANIGALASSELEP